MSKVANPTDAVTKKKPDSPVIRAAKAVVIGFKKPDDTLHGAIAEVARIIDLHVDLTGLVDAARFALVDLEPFEDTDLPNGYAVKATVKALRRAIAKATGGAK